MWTYSYCVVKRDENEAKKVSDWPKEDLFESDSMTLENKNFVVHVSVYLQFNNLITLIIMILEIFTIFAALEEDIIYLLSTLVLEHHIGLWDETRGPH